MEIEKLIATGTRKKMLPQVPKTENLKVVKTKNEAKTVQLLGIQDQDWKWHSKSGRSGLSSSPQKFSPVRAIVQPQNPEFKPIEIIKAVDENIDTKLFSPIRSKLVAEDDRKKAYDEDMKVLSSTKLELISKSDKECHLSTEYKTWIMANQSENSRGTPEMNRYEENSKGTNNYFNNGSGHKKPLLDANFTDSGKKMTQNIGTRLGGVPPAETMRAGLSSVIIGTDVGGNTPPRKFMSKSGQYLTKNNSQKQPPRLKEMAKGGKLQNIRAVFEKVMDKPKNEMEKQILPKSQESVKKLIGDYEKKVVNLSNFGHNTMKKNPLNNKLKSDNVLKLRSPIGKHINSPKNKKKFSSKKKQTIVKDLNLERNLQSPIQKFAKGGKTLGNDGQTDIRVYLTGPE